MFKLFQINGVKSSGENEIEEKVQKERGKKREGERKFIKSRQ